MRGGAMREVCVGVRRSSVREARSTVIMCAWGDHRKRTCSADATSDSMCAWTEATCQGMSAGGAALAGSKGYT